MFIDQVLRENEPVLTEIEIFLSYLLGKNRSFLKAFPKHKLNNKQVEEVNQFVRRRNYHEPLPYILGYKDFYRLRFKVDKRVMIPRPETENLVEKVIKYAHSSRYEGQQITIVDVGTGSGNIAISIAKNIPFAEIYGIEKDKDAFNVAKENVKLHNMGKQIKLIQGDLLTPLKKKAQIIVANLPYIPTNKIRTLMPEIYKWEPKIALDGGNDGMELYRKLFGQAEKVLKPGGSLIYEVDGDIFTKDF
jgi:release factor glutamine methyltransferase